MADAVTRNSFEFFSNLDRWIDQVIEKVRPRTLPQRFLWWTSTAGVTFFLYWNFYGRMARRRRKNLEEKLRQAEKTVFDLRQKLVSLETTDLIESDKKNKKEIRVWMDGVFDMMHFGHMNAFRQARSLGTYLVAGVCSDETTTACKGKPICSERERIDTVRGCKWVDEVVQNSPYVMNDEYLHYIIDKYKIDYIVHGDDPCIVDGKDAYESAVKLGKYLTIPRTEGVSTTDIVGRMLLMTTSHHVKNDSIDEHDDDVSLASQQTSTKKLVRSIEEDSPHYFDRRSNFLTTSRIIRLFGAGVKAPKPSDRVVYVAGAWDMFHAGHIETLEKAKRLGDYIIAGIYNDHLVNQHQGLNFPIMNLHERTLSVLGCKYVDDVLIDAPYVITQEMISSLGIHVVVRSCPTGKTVSEPAQDEEDPYFLARAQDMLTTVYTSHDITAMDFVDRIQNQRERYQARYAKKMEAELDFYKNKYSL